MKIELALNGEDLEIVLDNYESTQIKSFLEFFTRERLSDDIVTSEEYDVAEKLYKEISLYIGDEVIERGV